MTLSFDDSPGGIVVTDNGDATDFNIFSSYARKAFNNFAPVIGAKKGHVASRRAKPLQIDRRRQHNLQSCPHCGNENLSRRAKKHTRIIIDIPEGFNVETTEHTIERRWCNQCKKIVEPKVPDALDKCTFDKHPDEYLSDAKTA